MTFSSPRTGVHFARKRYALVLSGVEHGPAGGAELGVLLVQTGYDTVTRSHPGAKFLVIVRAGTLRIRRRILRHRSPGESEYANENSGMQLCHEIPDELGARRRGSSFT
jgi:hypothetical protein